MRFSEVRHQIQSVPKSARPQAELSEVSELKLENIFDQKIDLYRALQDLARFENDFQMGSQQKFRFGLTRFNQEGFLYLPHVITELWGKDCYSTRKAQVCELRRLGGLVSPEPKLYDLLVEFFVINPLYSEHYNYIKLSDQARDLIKLR
jgi:hypothetical protein